MPDKNQADDIEPVQESPKEEGADALEQCEKEKKDYLDGWQRARADFINYKKDEGRRTEDMARFIMADFIRDLLPVFDSFDLALDFEKERQESGEGKKERGALLIRTQLSDILKKRGFEKIAVKKGEKFNPEKHEGLGEIESDLPAGSVAEEVQGGYTLRGKVIRPARVKLAKNKI